MHSILLWFKYTLACLFFFFQFFEMTMFNTLSQPLMTDFQLSPSQISYLSAIFFLSCAIFVIPVGKLIDTYSIRKIILIGMAFSILNIILIQQSHEVSSLYFIRILQGAVHSFCFISLIKLATYYFPSRHMALATGLLVTIGMLGGFFAQSPLATLVYHWGWRETLGFISLGGSFVLLILFFSIDNIHPKNLAEPQYFSQLKKVFFNRQNWLAGIFASIVSLPIMVLGGLWGNQYLGATRQVNLIIAASICSMLFVGMLLGSPLMGYISDGLRRRCLPMNLAALFAFGLLIFLDSVPTINVISLHILFLVIGIITSTQIIAYPLITESNPPALTGISLALASMIVFIGPLISQLTFGWLIEHYGFSSAFLVLPTTLFFGFICTFFLKETYGKIKNS